MRGYDRTLSPDRVDLRAVNRRPRRTHGVPWWRRLWAYMPRYDRRLP